jgi:hypothetical protein
VHVESADDVAAACVVGFCLRVVGGGMVVTALFLGGSGCDARERTFLRGVLQVGLVGVFRIWLSGVGHDGPFDLWMVTISAR